MEEILDRLALDGAVLIEAAAGLVVFAGAVMALYQLIVLFVKGGSLVHKRKIYTQFGMWLLFGLEFSLAADIIRSAIAPNWSDIGQLAAIAAIRTFLNYFLSADIEKTIAAEANEQ